MRTSPSLGALAVVLVACSSAPAPAPVAPPPPAEPATPSPAERARVTSLAARFDGGARCDIPAVDGLRALRDRWGPAFAREGLEVAYAACDAPDALAELYRDTLPDPPTDEALLQLGVAWARADRFVEAADVLAPLAERAAPGSKTRWIAGFALQHAGRPEEALPLLEEARAHAGGEDGSEAQLLVGLARLQTGDVDGAVPELEAGLEKDPEDPSLLSALTRAYAATGRDADAKALAERTRAAHAKREATERRRSALSALSTNLQSAWDRKDLAEVERIVDRMWPLAPPALRPTLLEYRVAVYDATGRADEAVAARAQLAALRGATP